MLSIIIVNYNVKYFLEQCLYSVDKAIAGIEAEVIVIDNNSADESVAYLQNKFLWVKFIANKENSGYAKANNQGWRMASGDCVLFLNPDTILSEDCLQQSLAVLQGNRQSGALGIHMLDGSGRFLPESKRGFPSPFAALCKLSGLAKLFPHSRTIAGYYQGHLPEKQDNNVDVLSGAFMMVKMEVLEKTGGFDEQFFMYGEDIDLSYRIQQLGYTNYYFAGSSIIHFKGESTRKNFVYTRLFYKAMGIFVEKHYRKQSKWFAILVKPAIAVSGVLSFLRQTFLRRRPVRETGEAINTIIAGEIDETKQVAEMLSARGQAKRNITTVTDIREIMTAMQIQQPGSIVFCAGAISYREIIGCIENLHNNIEYKFFAAGSKSLVGSVSKDNCGETIVLE